MCIGKRGTNLIVHLFYVLFLFISANVFFASASIESSRPTESEKDEPMRNEDSTKISSPLPINETLPRVPKCCDLGFGFFFANKSKCIRTQNQFLPEFSDRPDYSKKASALPVLTRYEYYIGDPCLEGKYILHDSIDPYDVYKIYSNGTLLYSNRLYSKTDFCVESVDGVIRVFVCFEANKTVLEKDIQFILYAIGLLLSVPFLVVTALIYLCNSILRDHRGKSVACCMLCLAAAYFCLALVQLLSDAINDELCYASACLIQFLFVATFFWLNVVSFETWRGIRNRYYCIERPITLGNENTIFFYYCIYAIYGPVLVSTASLTMDLNPSIPDTYMKPNFGFYSCWFYPKERAVPYFYGPIAFTIFINFIFFFLSSKIIWKEQNRNAKISHAIPNGSGNDRRSSFSVAVYVKTLQECIYLFCLMGLNWTTEIISWIVGGSPWIWIISDVFNTLQGIMIFYMLVVRPKRVWNIFQRFLRRLIGCEAKISNCSNLEHIHSETTELTYTFQNNSNNNSNNSNIQNTFTP